jgi:hypothetical protein
LPLSPYAPLLGLFVPIEVRPDIRGKSEGGLATTVSYSGRSIRCRVTDRGPFIRGRIIDLPVSAARALGMMEAGVVRVSVE